ncbi:MAG: hypothetical protein DIU80_017855 [Chloroflexota bacterium]
MSTPSLAETPSTNAPARRLRRLLLALAAVAIVAIGSQLGVYSVQPIGALPEGATVIIWRAPGEPLFNSPDAECLRIQQGVSLLCRGVALGRAPVDRIVLRLPYIEAAYLLSTGGRSFER